MTHGHHASTFAYETWSIACVPAHPSKVSRPSLHCERSALSNRSIDREGTGCRLLLRRGSGWRFDVVGEPCQALKKALARGGTAGYDVPNLVLQLGQVQSLSDFLGFHSCGELVSSPGSGS